jgi:hypothetical protein
MATRAAPTNGASVIQSFAFKFNRSAISTQEKIKDNPRYNFFYQTNEAFQRDRTLETQVQQKKLQRVDFMDICAIILKAVEDIRLACPEGKLQNPSCIRAKSVWVHIVEFDNLYGGSESPAGGWQRLRRSKAHNIIRRAVGRDRCRLPGRGRPTVIFTTSVTAPVNVNPTRAVKYVHKGVY